MKIIDFLKQQGCGALWKLKTWAFPYDVTTNDNVFHWNFMPEERCSRPLQIKEALLLLLLLDKIHIEQQNQQDPSKEKNI